MISTDKPVERELPAKSAERLLNDALKALRRSNPERHSVLAQALADYREKERNDRGIVTEYPDRSFWLLDRGYLRWQLLRRNERYKTWVRNRLRNAKRLQAQSPRYFRDYSPMDGETFTSWEARVWRETTRKKNHAQMGREINATVSAFRRSPARLSDRWLPVPHNINFPHPKLLDLLTATTLGFAVTPVLFAGTKWIRLDGHSLWVVLSHSLDKINRETWDYFDADTPKRRREITSKLKTLLAKELPRRQRNTTPTRKRKNPKRDDETRVRMARILLAWDLKKNDATYTYREIAQKLWPEESFGQPLRIRGSRQALFQRAREHVKAADKLIAAVF